MATLQATLAVQARPFFKGTLQLSMQATLDGVMEVLATDLDGNALAI